MPTLTQTVTILLAGLILLNTGHGLVVTLLGVRMVQTGWATEAIGIIQSAYYVGFLTGTLFCGALIERVGHSRAFASLAVLASCTALIHALTPDPWVWATLRFASGFAMVGLYMIIESWLNASVTNTRRGQVLSLYMIINYVGAGAGQFLLPLGDPTGFELFSVVAIFTCAALLPISLHRQHGPVASAQPDAVGAARQRLTLRELWRLSPLALIGCLATGLSNSAFYAMTPVYASEMGMDTGELSRFMGLTILCGLLLQWPAGRYSDRVDRRLVILAVAGLSVLAAAALMALTNPSATALFIGMGVYVAFSFTLYSLSAAHANDHVHPDQLVAASAGLYLTFGVGAILGPTVAAQLMALLGPPGLFAYFVAIMGGVTLFTIYRMRRRESVPLEERGGDFVAMPPTSPVATTLDPRLEPVQAELNLTGDPTAEARTDEKA